MSRTSIVVCTTNKGCYADVISIFSSTEQGGVVVTSLACIWEVLDSNLRRDNSYTDLRFSWFPQAISGIVP
jgi:hypothetical protein